MIAYPNSLRCLASLVSVFLLSGCGEGGRFTRENPEASFTIIERGGGRQVKQGDFLKLHLVYKSPDGKTLFDSDSIGGGDFILESVKPLYKGALEEYLLTLNEGDSARFTVSADSMYKYTFEEPLPDGLKEGDNLQISLRLVKLYSPEEFTAEGNRLQLEQVETEARAIEIYLLENSLPVQAAKPGVYFFELKTGNGPKATAGDSVFIRYVGRFLNGEVFDGSHQSTSTLLSYRLGNGERLVEWERAVATMRVGSVARLILCSPFAYGSAGAGVIPPNTPLIFDMELVRIIPG